VVVFLVFAASMINVHLQSEERKLECTSDEGKGLGGILLTNIGGIFPATLSQRIL
jgi:hypothetical protein